MSEPVGKLGVVFNLIEGSGVTPKGDVCLAFRASDKRLYQIDIAPGCAALTLVALGERLGQIRAEEVQPIRITQAQSGYFSTGDPMVVLRTESGGEFPLVLPPHAVRSLLDILSGLVPEKEGDLN